MLRNSRRLILASVIGGVIVTPSIGSQSPNSAAPDLALRSIGGWGLNLADRDPNVGPGEDFNLFQNGGWQASVTIDPKKPAASYWADLRVLNSARVGALLAEAAQNTSASPDSKEGKLGTFYRSFLDIDTVRARGLEPLQPRLDAIRNAKSRADIAFLMGQFEGPLTERSISAPVHQTGTGLVTVDVVQDPQHPDRSAVSLQKAGLLMPNSDYYHDPRLADIKEKYQGYIAIQLKNIGWDDPEGNAAEIVKFETAIAEAGWPTGDAGTPGRVSTKQLESLGQGFEWSEYLKGAELSKAKEVLVDDRGAFERMAKVFAETPLKVLQARLAFALPDARARYLTGAPAEARLAFRGQIQNGQQVVLPPRASMAGDAVSANIGDLVGDAYLRKYFPPKYENGAREIVANLRKAFDNRIAHLDWMSPATKAHARKKLANMKILIRTAKDLRDYAGLQFDPKDLYGNLERATTYNWRARVDRLGKSFENLALMSPQVANYSYDPASNTAEAPAGLFQSPFYDPAADPAVNYGAVGTIVALTIVQGFVANSQEFDENGNHVVWWTPEEKAHFDALARRLSDQYSAIEPIPGVHVKGDVLLPESLGDNGALSVGLDAYHLSMGGKAAPVLDGFTGDQRFFMGRAQMWRAKFRPALVRNQLATASNAPPFLRINGSVRNVDAWYEAFGIKPGDKMYLAPEDRVRIW